MRVSNEKVLTGFLQGRTALSHGKTFSSKGGYLSSYNINVARLCDDGTVLIRSQDECPSATTSAHANKAWIASLKKRSKYMIPAARVPWSQLAVWGLSPEDITSAISDSFGGMSLIVRDEYCLHHPGVRGAPFAWAMPAYYVSLPAYLGTWFKLDRAPQSPMHFARSVLGSKNWTLQCLRWNVLWMGPYFFAEKDGTTQLPEGDAVSLPLGIFKLQCRQRGDITTGPFRLSGTDSIARIDLGVPQRRYAKLSILGDGCVPLNQPLDEQRRLELLEWP